MSVAFLLPPYMGMDRDIPCYLKPTPCSSTPHLIIVNVTLLSLLEKGTQDIFFKICLQYFCPSIFGQFVHKNIFLFFSEDFLLNIESSQE